MSHDTGGSTGRDVLAGTFAGQYVLTKQSTRSTLLQAPGPNTDTSRSFASLTGAANVISGHPFDTVKVVLQAQPGHHTNAVSAARHVVATSGTLGLYRGMTSPLIGGALETAVNYGVRCTTLYARGCSTPSARFNSDTTRFESRVRTARATSSLRELPRLQKLLSIGRKSGLMAGVPQGPAKDIGDRRRGAFDGVASAGGRLRRSSRRVIYDERIMIRCHCPGSQSYALQTTTFQFVPA